MTQADTEDRTLWLGDVPSYMDGSFLAEAFFKMGETVKNVKIIFDKYTGKQVQNLRNLCHRL